MGNNSGKKQIDESQKNLDELFVAISNKKCHILRSDLKKAWFGQIDEDLYYNVESFLFRANHDELNSQTFKRFFSDLCKGSPDQKVDVLYKLLGDSNEISRSKLLKVIATYMVVERRSVRIMRVTLGERCFASFNNYWHFWKKNKLNSVQLHEIITQKFITSIVNSILIIQETKSPKKFNSWNSRIGEKKKTESLIEYGTYFLEKIHKNEIEEYTKEDLSSLLIHLNFFLHMVVSRMYDTEEKHFYTSLLPKWKWCSIDSGKNLEQLSVLNLYTIMFLNLELPVDYQNEWRLLYSSHVDGESFARFSAQIINKGPTIIVIKDKEGYIFGGFAPLSWTLGPTFFGDSRSFLFTLHPKMNLFVATNFNNNYQYMNSGQQTMPNGLGMGGKLEYFGLWISAEFGRGQCSESCTTYRDYKTMSGSKNFEISHLEVWGVGPPPPPPSELGDRSVLDSDPSAKAILEIAGKTVYSQGLREEKHE